MAVKLLAVPGSHPCASAAAMLEAKGIAYERVDLVPAFSRLWLRLIGFEAGTVPALRFDGTRVQGTRRIARVLDERSPEPRLFPADPDVRMRVEQIEAWADGPLQDTVRRIILWSIARSRNAQRSSLEGARLQFRIPVSVALRVVGPILRLDAAIIGSSEAAVRNDLASLPRTLDRVDAWISEGRLDSDPPTAADFQVAGSVRLLLTVDDLAPVLSCRPVASLARRLIPRLPGHVPAGVIPAAWLPG